MDGNNIIIKQSYFNNIQTAINSLNEFCSSGFKVKNFPVLDGDFQIDPTIERIITRLDSVDPTWLEDEGKLNSIIEMINENISHIDPVDGVYSSIINSNNEMMINSIDAYVGFKILQTIADNFQDFIKFVNAIYSFELFTNPDKFVDVLDKFGKFIPFNEIPELDLEEKIFDEGFYVDGVFKNNQISLPQSMDTETEVERIINRAPLQGYEIYVDDSVQEAAEVNYFENTKPKHLKYSTSTKKWMISNQFEKTVNDMIAGLRKCDSTDDLKAFFTSDFWSKISDDPCDTIMPYILIKVMDNKSKFNNDTFKTENYSKSYASILKNNTGARRYDKYDIFSTFKSDKEGTIKFLEDFFKLRLVNNDDAAIENNTLLTIFNIFDSRIYLDIVYNITPDEARDGKTEDQFVKAIRGKINKNSHTAKTYTNSDEAQDPSPEDSVEDSKTVSEYVVNELHKLGDMSISDMVNCEHFSYLVERDIETLGDKMYNEGLSPFLIEEYIGESFDEVNNHMSDFIQEANVTSKRSQLQQSISGLMSAMEQIVELDRKHQWNANTFSTRYRQVVSPLNFLCPMTPVGGSEHHTNIKQTYIFTKKAIKGSVGNFTSEQLETLKQLHDLSGDLWGTVKLFWVNPRNWLKEFNLFRNNKKQEMTIKIAKIAKEIVAMKSSLEFIIDNDDFVTEAWYDGNPDYVFQEATTEKNHERLNVAISVLMKDMKTINDLSNKKQWTNNACINMFNGEALVNTKQALKYANRGVSGSCGKFNDSDKSTMKTLCEKLEELLSTIRKIKINPFIKKDIKTADTTRKIATLASDIVNLESSLAFIKNGSNASSSNDTTSADTATNDESTTTESFEYDIDKFAIIMEQETGELPGYMKERFKMTDNVGTTVSPADLPADVPKNPITDLTASIDSKLSVGGNSMDEMLGSGFEANPDKEKVEGKIVVNITNNYQNSFNRDSNNTTTNTTDDHSTGKTVTNTNSHNKSHSDNDNSHDNKEDASVNKKTSSSSSTKKTTDNSDRSVRAKSTHEKGTNNNNNSSESIDTKDSPSSKDGKQKLSSGKTVQEMFMFLESKEPQSNSYDATPPKETLLTKAMDKDRKSLATQQKAKKGVQNVKNTGKAIFKPITRTKQWLTKQVDSLIKRDEDTVKSELLENKSYRSAVFKASRLAVKLGLVSVAFAIQPYFGITLAALEGLRAMDKNRLKKELQYELGAEIDVINEKIRDLEHDNSPAARKQKYELMRLKKKFEQNLLTTPKRSTHSSYYDSY